MTETDPNGNWLHKPTKGPDKKYVDGTKKMFDALGTYGDSDVVADVTTILRFSTDMSLYTAELAQRMVDGFFNEYSKGVGDLSTGGTTLYWAHEFAMINKDSLNRFMEHIVAIGLTTTATGMAARAAAVDYANADGKGALDVQSVYGQELKKGQNALFTTGPDKKTVLSEAAKSPEQRAKEAADRKEQARQQRSLDEMLKSPETARQARDGALKAPVVSADPTAPIDYGQPRFPGPGGAVDQRYWKWIGRNGLNRYESGGEIIIDRDDEGVELPN